MVNSRLGYSERCPTLNAGVVQLGDRHVRELIGGNVSEQPFGVHQCHLQRLLKEIRALMWGSYDRQVVLLGNGVD